VRVLCVGNRYPPWSVGGYELIWAGFVSEMLAAGHAVRVLSTLPDPTDRAAGSEVVTGDVRRELRWYWRAHAFPQIGLRAAAELERFNARVLSRHLDELRPDAVMWWSMGGMSLSMLEQVRRRGVPGLGMVCDDWMLYGPNVDSWMRRGRRLPGVLAGAVERLAGVPASIDLDHAARWVFISEYARQAAVQNGWRLPDSTVEHSGFSAARFPPSEAGPWRWRLLYCGRLDPRKGVATAIRALARLPGVATLTIKGDGPAGYASELRELARNLDVGERVRFEASSLGDSVHQAYTAADALLFPVIWREPWGLVPLEAMSVGRPVLASRAGGGAAEYLVDGRNCLQFAPEDDSALAAAVVRLAEEPALRRSLVEAGRSTAAQFTAERFNQALARELAAVASRSS
jgi:glycogen(starch) synthase